MRPGLRHRLGRSGSQRLKLAVSTTDKSLNNLVRQHPLTNTCRDHVIAERAKIVRQT
jgi:hypothetical protein